MQANESMVPLLPRLVMGSLFCFISSRTDCCSIAISISRRRCFGFRCALLHLPRVFRKDGARRVGPSPSFFVPLQRFHLLAGTHPSKCQPPRDLPTQCRRALSHPMQTNLVLAKSQIVPCISIQAPGVKEGTSVQTGDARDVT